ncbi:MAG: hypothetical protein JM58_05085 [Peptococcaceae bacterium BICA1-8]|nr:MAG: hypothetical protein JM58_05085 [Peptococcaceae bacterium BICA1-8]
MILYNIIVGGLIGWLSDSWMLIVVFPFIWGIVFCIYSLIYNKRERDYYVAKLEQRFPENDGKTKLGIPYKVTFYLIECQIAALTTLVFAVIVGLVKSWL